MYCDTRNQFSIPNCSIPCVCGKIVMMCIASTIICCFYPHVSWPTIPFLAKTSKTPSKFLVLKSPKDPFPATILFFQPTEALQERQCFGCGDHHLNKPVEIHELVLSKIVGWLPNSIAIHEMEYIFRQTQLGG